MVELSRTLSFRVPLPPSSLFFKVLFTFLFTYLILEFLHTPFFLVGAIVLQPFFKCFSFCIILLLRLLWLHEPFFPTFVFPFRKNISIWCSWFFQTILTLHPWHNICPCSFNQDTWGQWDPIWTLPNTFFPSTFLKLFVIIREFSAFIPNQPSSSSWCESFW